MAQDIRKLFESEKKVSHKKMSQGHEIRFLEKLDRELQLPEVAKKAKNQWSILQIAASVVVLLGLSFAGFNYFKVIPDNPTEVTSTKSIGEISPQLKKVEDYYLANINLELSKIKYTPETKELFDGYVKRLGELSTEYERLSDELFQSGSNEQTVTALIDNLKMRLNLLYRLKEKLKELNQSENEFEEIRS